MYIFMYEDSDVNLKYTKIENILSNTAAATTTATGIIATITLLFLLLQLLLYTCIQLLL